MRKKLSSQIITFLVVLVLPGLIVWGSVWQARKITHPNKVEMVNRADQISSVDHSQFAILQQEFKRPQDVTAACLSCHTERDKEIMATAHWTWEREIERAGEIVKIGKQNLVNNFCTGANGNNGSCMKCHIGYGWADNSFDFNEPTNIDCLVCHDLTRTYVKRKGGAGMPATPETATAYEPVPDYAYIAQNVGAPGRHNCGFCHFEGGGGNNVKHGDLENALIQTTRKVDVHMGMDGGDMSCVDCHTTERHNIMGRLYSVSATNDNRVTCEQCHTSKPHGERILDNHFNKVACQTCHIPVFAKVNPTVMYWDWSKAGRKDEYDKFITELDSEGSYSYLSIKGRFVWDKNVEPEYVWFNGTASHFINSDTITEIPVKINQLYGDATCPDSKIWPVKIHRGKQAFDSQYKTILNMKVFAERKGEGAFWQDLDMDKAIALGMEYNERPYSGTYEFVETEVYWPVNHMVSSKEESLRCIDCHAREGGRLDGLNGFYLPGRDYSVAANIGGKAIVILTLLGVVIHMALRIIIPRRKLNS
jgi:octaheme c-type cytochrome (tetrathionate reductase family)